MTVNIEVEERGFDEQIAKLKKYDQISARNNARAMSDTVKLVSRVAKALAPGSGRIAGGIDKEIFIKAEQGVIGRVVGKTFDALWVEFGTAPHGVPSEAIQQKLPVDMGEAFLIARAIQFRGARGSHFMYRAFKSSERALMAFWKKAIGKTTKDLEV
jgi:hypothetical protein